MESRLPRMKAGHFLLHNQLPGPLVHFSNDKDIFDFLLYRPVSIAYVFIFE